MAEGRHFPPDPAFTAQANATAEMYAEADADFEAFWAKPARERIKWSTPSRRPSNGTSRRQVVHRRRAQRRHNCVDRHVERGLGDKVAYHWIGEPGDKRTITYRDLQREVCKTANALKELGVDQGDRVAIYMPMIPELPIAMLACARIGAPHTVVFGGFSAEALSGRINDCRARSSSPPTAAIGAARRSRSRATPTRRSKGRRPSSRDRRQADRRRRRPMVDGPRPLVARPRRPPVRDCPARPDRLRAHAVPALHLGHNRQAQGHPPHDRRLPRRDVVQPRRGLRHQARRRVLVRRRHRLGDRPQLHRLRPPGERDDRRSCTRARPTRRPGTAGGRSSRSTRSRSCIAPRPRSARS